MPCRDGREQVGIAIGRIRRMAREDRLQSKRALQTAVRRAQLEEGVDWRGGNSSSKVGGEVGLKVVNWAVGQI